MVTGIGGLFLIGFVWHAGALFLTAAFIAGAVGSIRRREQRTDEMAALEAATEDET